MGTSWTSTGADYATMATGLSALTAAAVWTRQQWQSQGARRNAARWISLEPVVTHGEVTELMVVNHGPYLAKFKCSVVHIEPQPAAQNAPWELRWSGSSSVTQEIGPRGGSWPVDFASGGCGVVRATENLRAASR